MTCGNRSYVVSKPYIKDTKKLRAYSGRKGKAAGFVYLQGLPYCDVEGSSQLISFLRDTIINYSLRREGN